MAVVMTLGDYLQWNKNQCEKVLTLNEKLFEQFQHKDFEGQDFTDFLDKHPESLELMSEIMTTSLW